MHDAVRLKVAVADIPLRNDDTRRQLDGFEPELFRPASVEATAQGGLARAGVVTIS
jgi:hypothetical protein